MPRQPLLFADALLSGASYDRYQGPAWEQDLEDKLFDMRRLRRVPFQYLVPDPSLLPPESVRFFHVDRSWVDRLIDGAVSAALVGSGDQEEAAEMARVARRALDDREKVPRNTYRFQSAAFTGSSRSRSRDTLPEISGMLMRSAVVRRWPKTEVRGYSTGGSTVRAEWTLLDKVRHERLSDSIVMVLWAGCPDYVEVEEPKDGVQYGVDANDGTITAEVRNPDGSLSGHTVPATFRVGGRRVLSIRDLRAAMEGVPGGSAPGNAALALTLQQTPFVQEFRGAGGASVNFTVLLPELRVLTNHGEILLAILNGAQG